jgi:hypothetical protein
MIEVLPSWVVPVVAVLAVVAVVALIAAVAVAMLSRRVTSADEPYLPRGDDAPGALEMDDVDESHSHSGGEHGEHASGTTSTSSKPVPARHLVKK